MKPNQTKRNNKKKWLQHAHYDPIGYYATGLDWAEEPFTWNIRCHRRLQTNNERRQSFLTTDETDYGIRIRGRRQGRTLPNSWDDYVISEWYSRKSWKHNSKRKKQWKFE